ncbi:hypothetical protein QUF61_17550 [Candidatus Venteria ishoeyi]|uniref:hypothetical protein n=1 Tax=Candidatus Venteria ishoeyi TaxID=1899563 RepID=UPI0025A5E50F|nr:hypothetical protein [Candidatus Venteria ishoeyi]MDM8548300.1 hypothetical protein [Candidatus Venteria ishoeyi]
MKNIEEAKKILTSSLSNIYCDSCKNDGDDDRCDGCNRKAMGWEPAEWFIESMAKEIVGEK